MDCLILPATPPPASLDPAVRVLRNGGVVAFATDTLYGLAADPRDGRAVRRVFALKGRAESAALPLVACDLAQALEAAVLDARAQRLAERWWPGPLTIVAPARPGIAPETLAHGTTIGVRVPAHDAARALARRFGFALTATSANRSGHPPTADPDVVAAELPDVDLILDTGRAPGGPPSTIVEVREGDLRLIREGAVAWSRVLESRQ
jgi:L-threonylcarbamoyladenylate synthase